MITVNTTGYNAVSVYGTTGAETMTLRSLSTNDVIELPLCNATISERYGLYIMVYDTNLEFNTADIIDEETHFNILPGKYEYTAAGVVGIFYLRDIEKDNKIYEQENSTKTYQG